MAAAGRLDSRAPRLRLAVPRLLLRECLESRVPRLRLEVPRLLLARLDSRVPRPQRDHRVHWPPLLLLQNLRGRALLLPLLLLACRLECRAPRLRLECLE